MERLEEKLLVFLLDKQPASWIAIVKHFIAECPLHQVEDAAAWLAERRYADPDPGWATGWELTEPGKEVAQLLKTLHAAGFLNVI